MKRDKVEVLVVQLQAGGQGGGQVQRLCPAVFDADGAANGVHVVKHGVEQADVQVQRRVFQRDFQRGAVFSVTGGQAL